MNKYDEWAEAAEAGAVSCLPNITDLQSTIVGTLVALVIDEPDFVMDGGCTMPDFVIRLALQDHWNEVVWKSAL